MKEKQMDWEVKCRQKWMAGSVASGINVFAFYPKWWFRGGSKFGPCSFHLQAHLARCGDISFGYDNLGSREVILPY